MTDVVFLVTGAATGPGGEIVAPGDMYGQAKFCIEVMRKTIEELGRQGRGRGAHSGVRDGHLPVGGAGRAHGEVFGKIQPASAFIGVSEFLHPDLMIEIEATAIVR